MGIHISVKKILGTTMEEAWGASLFSYVETEDQKWFDHLRHSGDADFVSQNKFVSLDDESRYKRPEDFTICRKWVNENVVECNRQRLLTALDNLEQDNSLAFSWSW